MKKIRLFASLLAALALLGACARWHAMKGPYTEEGVNPDFVEHVVRQADRRLDLTPEQSRDLRGIVEKIARAAYEQRQEKQALKTSLTEQVRLSRLDPAVIDRLFSRKIDMLESLYKLGRDDLVAFHATLSEEQRNKLATAIEEHHRGHGHHGW